ncbi:hypothetical protein [Runella sp.]|uniref:hypothetical protein n=1 Tax=Runella sp. TaxID=1960881 RepID=UPI002604222B|nr:hypothetical protein [Runella sp.]
MASIPKNMLTFEEPFGDTNGRKTVLKEVSEGYRRLLEEKMGDLKIDAERIGKQALVIGGTIAAAYLLLELLLPDEEPEIKTASTNTTPVVIERREESSSWITKAVTSYAITWALGMARQKLMDFLATQKNRNEVRNTNETSA